MITAELRVNGQFIGHIYARNEGGEVNGWCEYRYECYTLNDDSGNSLVNGKVRHFRPNGAVALFKEICEDVGTRGSK